MHRLCFLSIFVGRIKILTFHIDIAYYFRHNPLTLAEAEARGLLPKTRAGEQTAASRIGLTVAANAGDNTFTLPVNGKCTAEDAYMACLIATTEEGQQLAPETRAGNIAGTEFAPDGRKLTDKVTEFWNKEYGEVAKNPILGDVVLDTRSVKASIAHGVGRLKSAAFTVVHDVIEKGVLVEIAPDWKRAW